MGGLPRPPRTLGAARLIGWRVDPEPPGPLGADDALVWLVRPAGDLAAAILARVRASAADLADAAAWEGAERGAARLRRRLLLRVLAAEALGVATDAVAVAREPGGRPRIFAPRSAWAAVARGGDWAALAVARRPVGVDLAPSDAKADWSLAPQARDPAVRTAGETWAFAAAWAGLEAYAKATGQGLGEGPQPVLTCDRQGLAIEHPRGRARLHLRKHQGWMAAAVVL